MASMRSAVSWLVVLALFAGCGGKTAGSGDEDAEDRDDVGGSGDDDATDRPGTSNPPKAPNPPPQPSMRGGNTPLGECDLGFDPGNQPERPCDWIAEGLCYDSKIAACACVCPRDRHSYCVSDFFVSPGLQTPVSCF
jgi:hypothetical protein